MLDELSSLPLYPKKPGSELPPLPGWYWGAAVWVGCVVWGTAVLSQVLPFLVHMFLLAFWLAPLLSGMQTLMVLGIFIFAWQRSEQIDR
jgi:hypothetical protein